MELFKHLKDKGYKYVVQGDRPNQFAANPNIFNANTDGAAEWNKIYTLCLESDLNKLQRTNSGAISTEEDNDYCYDVRHNTNGGVITIFAFGKLYVFKIGHWSKERKTIAPYVAFSRFFEKCSEFGIDLMDYSIDNGKEVKQSIPKPYIIIFKEYISKTATKNVHHIDFHSSYPAGLINTHPEFRPVVEYFYNRRNLDPTCKDVLNMTIGNMQSLNNKQINARWAHLAKDAISDNNKRIDDLSIALLRNGNEILGYNTDGIWYAGKIYHGSGEGSNIGEWENDHTNCIFRAKSSGAYEFIENKQYNVVVRGITKLDQIKPRSQWEWGDIFKTSIDCLVWQDDTGFINSEL